MKQYRKKPVVIEAVQYIIGNNIPEGVNVTKPEIIFSKDGKLFYPSHTNSNEWLSLDKNKDGKYDSYPFVFYEIKSGDRKPLNEYYNLFEIYQKCFNVNIPKEYAWIETLEGNMKVSEYDWVIKGVNGEFYPCKPDIFEKTYEPVINQ